MTGIDALGINYVTVPDFSVNLAKQSKTYEDDVYKETTELNWGRISKELALNWRKIDVKLKENCQNKSKKDRWLFPNSGGHPYLYDTVAYSVAK